jgi:hypothetical protein
MRSSASAAAEFHLLPLLVNNSAVPVASAFLKSTASSLKYLYLSKKNLPAFFSLTILPK